MGKGSKILEQIRKLFDFSKHLPGALLSDRSSCRRQGFKYLFPVPTLSPRRLLFLRVVQDMSAHVMGQPLRVLGGAWLYDTCDM